MALRIATTVSLRSGRKILKKVSMGECGFALTAAGVPQIKLRSLRETARRYRERVREALMPPVGFG